MTIVIGTTATESLERSSEGNKKLWEAIRKSDDNGFAVINEGSSVYIVLDVAIESGKPVLPIQHSHNLEMLNEELKRSL